MQPNDLLLNKLVEEWNRCHGAFYQMRAVDLQWHLKEQDWLSYSLQEVAGVPVLCAEASAAGRAAGISAKTLWLSAWGALTAHAEGREKFALGLDKIAPSRGKTRLCVGGEDFHLIPGIPEAPEDAAFNLILEKAGFTFAEAVDYAGPIRSDAIQQYVREGLANAEGLRLETVSDEPSLAELGDFMKKEFSGRWEREFRFWRGRQDTRRAHWNLLRRGSRVCGFARLTLRGNGEGWIPGALRFPLATGSVDQPTDACLGPIGVAASERGKGTGKILLGLSLQFLLGKQAERLCIDWTNAYNYYKPLGLPVVRRYRTVLKDY